MKKNRLCALLGVDKPICQGPMSWVSTAPLAAAVSAAGGFGVLGTAAATPDFIRAQVKLLKSETDKPFAINMGMHPAFLPDDYFNALIQVMVEEKVPFVHMDTLCDENYRMEAEFVGPRFKLLKEKGIKIIAKVFTVYDALVAQEAGADAIIMKGWEGGGHTTMQTTMVNIPQAADVLRVPLIASGGIADGRGMAAAMIMGADGIEMGTAFLAAEETAIHENAKQAVIEAGDFSTVEVGASANAACRQLRNELSDAVEKIESSMVKAEAAPKVIEMTDKSLRNAMQGGDTKHEGAVMAGQAVGLVKKIRPVAEIIDSTLNECAALLASAPGIAVK